jgi:hypothetical protein
MSGSNDENGLLPEAAGSDTGKDTSENQQTGTTEMSDSGIILSTKPKTPRLCNTCTKKHFPPTGQKCPFGPPPGITPHDSQHQGASSSLVGPPSEQLPLVGAGSGVTNVPQNLNSEVLLQVTDVLSKFAVRLDSIEQKLNDRPTVPAPMNIAQAQRQTPVQGSINIPQVQRHCSLTPSLSELKADKVLVSQAQRLTDEVAFSGTGLDINTLNNIKNFKRGLFRSGGDIAPSRRVPWPQDFVAGAAMTSKLMYKDLNLYQWLEGYACIVERETNANLSCLMLSHFRALMRDAQGHGWEAAREAHSAVLDAMEQGEFDWTDEVKVAECRRSIITNQLTASLKQQYATDFREPKGQGYISQSGSNGLSRGQGRNNRPVIKICDFYNKGVCSHRSDHRNAGIYWRHVCRACSGIDHVEKDCSFLSNITQA